MATDVQKILRHLIRFYDFRQKRVLHIGAGGGQFLLNPEMTQQIIAVDNDRTSVQTLKKVIDQKNLSSKVIVVEKDFYDLNLKADVVLFEFCLHEMADPLKALKQAGSLANDIVIIDHSKDSEWAWYVCETEKATRSWEAAKECGIKKSRRYRTTQYFTAYPELYNKVQVMGPESIIRISKFRDATGFKIPMAYQIALINQVVR
jgi:predicted RNA methylase